MVKFVCLLILKRIISIKTTNVQEENWNSPPFSEAPFVCVCVLRLSLGDQHVIKWWSPILAICTFCRSQMNIFAPLILDLWVQFISLQNALFLIQNALCTLLHWCATVVHAFWCSTPLCLLFKSGWRQTRFNRQNTVEAMLSQFHD